MGFFDVFTTREFGQGVARAGEQLGAGLSEANRLERDKKRRELEEKLLELKVEREEEAAKEKGEEFTREEEARKVISTQEQLFQESREFERPEEFLRDVGPGEPLPTREEIISEEEKFDTLKTASQKSRPELLENALLGAGLQDTKVAKNSLDFLKKTKELKPVLKTRLEAMKEQADVNKINAEFRKSNVVQDLLKLDPATKKLLFGDDVREAEALSRKFEADPLGTLDDILKSERSNDIQRLMAAEFFKASLKKKVEKDKSIEESETILANIDTMFIMARSQKPEKGFSQKMIGLKNIAAGKLGLNPIAATFLNMRGIIGNQIARTVGRESGVMTDRDRKFAMASMPSLLDTSRELDAKELIFNTIADPALSRAEKNIKLIEGIIDLSLLPGITESTKDEINRAFAAARKEDPNFDNIINKRLEGKSISPISPTTNEASLQDIEFEIRRRKTTILR